MELTPEEKKRIYEEEKERMEAQEKIKGEQAAEKAKKEAEKTNKGCMGCLAVIAIIFVISFIWNVISPTDKKSPSDTASKSSTYDLKASVQFTGTQFVITNNDSFDWTRVKLEINSGYVSSGYILETEVMKAGQTYTVGAMQFAKADGTRFNPYSMKPQKFVIDCKTPKGGGLWFGGWK